MALEAIIFDLDGTIVNSPEIQWDAFNDYLKQFNVQISWADWTNHYLGEKSEAIWHAIFNKHSIVADLAMAQKERRAKYRRLVNEGKLHEIKGFSKFFNWLKATISPAIPIVIASNGHPSSIETSLKAIGYLDRIKYYSAEHGSLKITKDHLLSLVVRDLQVSAKNCLVLEDSSLGAAAAKELGMKVIAINSSNLQEGSFQADLVVKDYKDPALFSFVRHLG